MGEVQVPAAALWRAQTQRAVENFPISGTGLEAAHVHALGEIKAAAARANAELGVLDADLAEAVEQAARDVAAGLHDDHFPVDVFQTGSGTSSNMNANEVIATLASRSLGRPVHPNDAVNASQSSNDVFPTSIHLAATEATTRDLLVEDPEPRVDPGGGRLDESQRLHVLGFEPGAADREVLHRPLRLRPPQGLPGDLDLAHAVALDAELVHPRHPTGGRPGAGRGGGRRP